MSSRHRLAVFLVASASFLADNLIAFLIVESLIDGHMLIESTDDIITSSILSSVLQVFLLGQMLTQS